MCKYFLHTQYIFIALVIIKSCLADDSLDSVLADIFPPSSETPPVSSNPITSGPITSGPITSGFINTERPSNAPRPIFVTVTNSTLFPTFIPVTSKPPSSNLIIDPNTGVGTTGCSLGYDCVVYYLCKNDSIIKDGEGLLDIRFDNDVPQECPSLEQCCAIENQSDVPVVVPKPQPAGCGYSNPSGIGYKITVAKQNETEFGEFPWHIAILREEIGLDRTMNIYECGGSLIHPQVVLTAAHCVKNKNHQKLIARAGEWDTQSKGEIFPEQDRRVSEVVIHEHYYSGGLYNDIALLFLTHPFNLTLNVQPICLPPINENFNYRQCIATGWGKTSFGQYGKYSVILKKVQLPVVPRDKCQEELRKTRLGKYFELHSSFLCAGGKLGEDTCKGDGGSPLVCPLIDKPNRYYQAGIVAWGIGCGDEIPAVYVNIPALRPWIDEQLAYKRIDSSYFTP